MKRTFLPLLVTLSLIGVFSVLAVAAEPEESVTIPAGTTINARLTMALSTGANHDGDPFSARITDPIFDKGIEVVPAGSILEGHVAFVKEPGRVKGRAEMRLLAETITTPEDKATYSIVAGLQDLQGAEGAKVKDQEGTIQGPGRDKKGTAVETGVGAAVGAGVGAIAAGGKGGLYGLAIGGLAGLIHNMSKRGKDVILPQGTEVTFEIQRTISAKRVPKPVEPFVVPSSQ